VIEFADLLERLEFTRGETAKAALLRRYLATAPDADREIATALFSGTLELPRISPLRLRELVASRVDPVLFALSRAHVGHLTETVALIWPQRRSNAAPPRLSEVVETLASASKADMPQIVTGWLDASDTALRVALLKLLTGGPRIARPEAAAMANDTDPHRVAAVLMYAQRGEFTFGLWRGAELVPVGRTSAATGEECAALDAYVRANTVARFGPVREVAAGLVVELAFDAVEHSTRRKSGVTLRAPRIARLLMDKQAGEADQLEALLRLIERP
jgi:ATP-dependent DNA ligase